MQNKNKNNFSIKKLIYNDKYLIIISIILSIVIWCATSMNLSPETTKTINVAVASDFTDSVPSQLGIKCYGDDTINVEVTISCKKYMAKDITADNINVYLQTNSVTSTGNHDVPIKVDIVQSADFEVLSYYPTVYHAYFDVEDEKVMDISLDYDADALIDNGYIIGDALLSESSVTVRGPKAYLSQVARVTAPVRFTDKLNKTQNIELQLSAVNNSGLTVDYIDIITKSDNVTLTIPVLKKATLDVTTSFTSKPAKLDVSDFNIAYSTDIINAGVLEDAGISEANIGSIDFSKLKVGRNSFTFNVKSAENFTVIDDLDEITVTVVVPNSYYTTTLSVNEDNVEITNIPEGYKVELISLSSNNVTAVGKKADLQLLNNSSVKLSVDLSSIGSDITLGNGEYDINATLINSESCWIYGDYFAVIRIYK